MKINVQEIKNTEIMNKKNEHFNPFSEESVENNHEDKQTIDDKIGDFIALILMWSSVISFMSCIIFMFQGDSDKWFSRLTLSLICLGFSGIIFRLRK